MLAGVLAGGGFAAGTEGRLQLAVLILSILLFALTASVYWFVVRRQGRVLRERETQILETVTQVGS